MTHDILNALIHTIGQMDFPISVNNMKTIAAANPNVTAAFIDYFEQRFNPDLYPSLAGQSLYFGQNGARKAAVTEAEDSIISLLFSINSKEHRRALNHIYAVLQSILRTNYYQNKDYIAFKFQSENIPDLPKPTPLYEIFVYAPHMEGLHLRAGKVSRGGIRWSDRLTGFRQEILDLMKTQTIKNAIIVPLGSKGGFICRNYETMKQNGASKAELKDEVIHCYKTLIKGMLDLTDNQINGQIIPPPQTVCYDEPDPYLVVAADKGTASFSDISNELANDYGFWLGDAFASGGSAGFDHKKMGITSHGAWVSVESHMQALNLSNDYPLRIVGVGDMSGDVFGNGMLISQHIHLIAAFNHTHIFLDPTPDPIISHTERKRLFNQPDSTWGEYDQSLLSKGGGVFKRDAQTINLSPEIQKALDLNLSTISPEHLIQELLKAPIDLLWFGGIGTYVKASDENDAAAHDLADDRLRINAKQIRARIIGEGANLAMTQKARIEYALNGGKINTDAIDNSAGVSCSDHEVNIKIMFSDLIANKYMTLDDRNALLHQIEPDVAALVLKDNHDQNAALTILEKLSESQLSAYDALLKQLEHDLFMPLDRELESLPTPNVLKKRAEMNLGLTRPELAVILAYSKINFFKRLLDPTAYIIYWGTKSISQFYQSELLSYFPAVLQENYKSAISVHPLAPEIIATRLSNELINHLGPLHAFEMLDMCSGDSWKTMDAYRSICHSLKKHLKKLSSAEDMMLPQQLMVSSNFHHSIRDSFKGDFDAY